MATIIQLLIISNCAVWQAPKLVWNLYDTYYHTCPLTLFVRIRRAIDKILSLEIAESMYLKIVKL